jgi:hypothetical protein
MNSSKLFIGSLHRIIAIAVIAVASLFWGHVGMASEHGGHGEAAKPAEQGGHGGGGGHDAHSEAAPPPDADATKAGSDGLDLGEFRIRAYYPDKTQKSTASFALYATVTKDKLGESQHLLENRLNKMRDQIIVVTRLMPLGDFDDPELKNFRRRILLQLRRILPELSIENVYVSDFNIRVERI